MEEIFTFIVAIFLLIAPFIDWTSAYILHRASKEAGPSGIAIGERSRMATVLAVSNSFSGLLALARLFSITLGSVFVVILAASLLLSSVPNTYWLYLFLKKKLQK